MPALRRESSTRPGADPAGDFAYTLSGTSATITDYIGASTMVDIPAAIGNGAFAANALTTVIFNGAAPTTLTAAGPTGSLDTGAGLTLYYYAGASGFTSPWEGYTSRAISAAYSDLTVTPAGPIPAGATPYTLTVMVRDDTGTPVAGVPVTFAVPSGATASATACTSAADGACAVTLGSAAAAPALTPAAATVRATMVPAGSWPAASRS